MTGDILHHGSTPPASARSRSVHRAGTMLRKCVSHTVACARRYAMNVSGISTRQVSPCSAQAVLFARGFSTPSDEDFSLHEFHHEADALLENLETQLEELGDLDHLDDFDLDNAQGVLTLQLGKPGTYVINKQAPNKQVWWSSPISGPLRFDMDVASRKWVNHRDNTDELCKKLEDELLELTGAAVFLQQQ